ncbi:putative flippase GtrA [Paenibacillus anaericanus]|uniref:GtrA family protein n=1 Tax=Paenibacillus anaericanus TaxID=170367 RepID=UPI00278AA6B6|nr:GtrA family protein [Paenibacillus anaericanus]MDQ0089972.1 putative flippase GtrA [Paenibacillus anaericanus]
MKNKMLKKLREYPVIINFIQYGFVGVLGTVIHTAVLALFVEYFNVIPVLSTFIGFLFSLVASYRLNSVWTFKQRNRNKNSFIKYTIACSAGLVINVAIMFIVVDLLKYSYLIGQFISIIIVPVFNFSLSRYWVFNLNEKGTH